MIAAQIIADLDAALARTGETVTVRRYTGSGDPRPKVEIAVKASVRGVKAEQLAGRSIEATRRVVLSPTGLAALLPLRVDDKIVVRSGQVCNVSDVEEIYVQDTLVRINLLVTG